MDTVLWYLGQQTVRDKPATDTSVVSSSSRVPSHGNQALLKTSTRRLGNYRQAGCGRGLFCGKTLAKTQPAGVFAPCIDSASVDLFSLCRWLQMLLLLLSVFPVCFLISSCFLVFNKCHLSFHLLPHKVPKLL